MVTVMECVNAMGTAIKPLVIHAGAEKDAEWIRARPNEAHLACSPNGWTDSDAALWWLREVFDVETKPTSKEIKRLLILDGHISHVSLEFILQAEKLNIILLLLPPHTTHRLQPLDVGAFGPLSTAWSRAVRTLQDNGRTINKVTFLATYLQARSQALTPRVITSAFGRCGIHPYDPSKITEEEMAPAEKTTCRASQPLPAVLPSFLEPVPECTNEPFEASIPFNPSMATTPVLLRTTRTHALGGPFLEVSINVPRVRQIDLPKCPGQNATKKELLEVINRDLFRLIWRMPT